MGCPPSAKLGRSGSNDFFSGEKRCYVAGTTADLSIETTFRFKDFQTKGAAGILSETRARGLGYDRPPGYFAESEF